MILTGWNTQRVGTGKKGGSISRADSSAASVEGGDLGTPRSGAADGTPGTPRESSTRSGEEKEKLSPGAKLADDLACVSYVEFDSVTCPVRPLLEVIQVIAEGRVARKKLGKKRVRTGTASGLKNLVNDNKREDASKSGSLHSQSVTSPSVSRS